MPRLIRKLNSAWKDYSPLAHIVGWLVIVSFVAGGIWFSFNGTQALAENNEIRITAVESDIGSMKSDLAVIKESLRWIERALGRR